jgi:hypothetical protein
MSNLLPNLLGEQGILPPNLLGEQGILPPNLLCEQGILPPNLLIEQGVITSWWMMGFRSASQAVTPHGLQTESG